MPSSPVRSRDSSSKISPLRLTFRTGDGLALAADAWGDPAGRPVLLAHGGGQTRHAWGGTAQVLAGRGCYAVSLDLRGHGDSDWSPDGDYLLDRFADDVRKVAAELGQPILVGASLGGLSAMLAGGEEPRADLAGIVLVDIAPHIEERGSDRVLSFMRDKLEAGFATLDEAADAVAAYMPERPRPTDLKGLEKNLRQREDGRWRWHWDPRFVSGDRRIDGARRPERLAAAVKNIACPMLLVRGRMSDVISEDSVRRFLELKPDARFVDIARAGHMVAGDANDVFTEAVTAFLDDLD